VSRVSRLIVLASDLNLVIPRIREDTLSGRDRSPGERRRHRRPRIFSSSRPNASWRSLSSTMPDEGYILGPGVRTPARNSLVNQGARFFRTTRSQCQSAKPKRGLVLAACVLARYILYIYMLFLSLSFFHSLSLSLSLYKSSFGMKIISSAARFVAVIRHSGGSGAPESGDRARARTAYSRPGHRPINTRTGSPVPAT